MTNSSPPAGSQSAATSAPADSHFDFIVIGSGFAGSLIACILQSQGRRVAIIDRSSHPRFAIGESSTPAAGLILSSLADQYQLHWLKPLAKYGSWKKTWPQITTGRKRGFSYFHHESGRPFQPAASHSNELLAMASSSDDVSDTQWLRSDVDAFIFRQACRTGVVPFEDSEINELSEKPPGWRLDIRRSVPPGQSSDRHGSQQRNLTPFVTLTGDFLIDASGSGQVLARWFDIEDQSDKLSTGSRAIFAHVTGLPRWQPILEQTSPCAAVDHPFPCDNAALHHVLDEGWMWWLRFDSDVTSIGLVLDDRTAGAADRTDPKSEFQAIVSRYPDLRSAFETARFTDDPLMPVGTERLQRLSSQIAGSNWAMLPHTAGFIDPLHSTGIAHSLAGIERLADILLTSQMDARTVSLDAKLQHYASTVHDELTLIDQLVAGCYDAMAQRSFRKFVAFTMCYFAAATSWEHQRLKLNHDSVSSSSGAGHGTDRKSLCPALLCADSEAFRTAVFYLRNELVKVSDESFERLCRETLAPFNRVGLFEPPIPNMYGATAVPD